MKNGDIRKLNKEEKELYVLKVFNLLVFCKERL